MKTAYIALSLDFIHHGHINIINKASKYGKITLGLLTDKAISEKNKFHILLLNKEKILQKI
jgi:glycerol-3-phosphate cytidylyltransferase-like family protein